MQEAVGTDPDKIGNLRVWKTAEGAYVLGFDEINDGSGCMLRRRVSSSSKLAITLSGSESKGRFKLSGGFGQQALSTLNDVIMELDDTIFVDMSAGATNEVTAKIADCAGYSLPLFELGEDYPKRSAEYAVNWDYKQQKPNQGSVEEIRFYPNAQMGTARCSTHLLMSNGNEMLFEKANGRGGFNFAMDDFEPETRIGVLREKGDTDTNFIDDDYIVEKAVGNFMLGSVATGYVERMFNLMIGERFNYQVVTIPSLIEKLNEWIDDGIALGDKITGITGQIVYYHIKNPSTPDALILDTDLNYYLCILGGFDDPTFYSYYVGCQVSLINGIYKVQIFKPCHSSVDTDRYIDKLIRVETLDEVDYLCALLNYNIPTVEVQVVD